MINNQWYAVLSSNEVKKGKVVGVRRFGENLIFFRNEKGEIGCITSLCAHRSASLAKGCVTDGHVRCPFHGIEYDVTGKCVYVPSEGRASTADYGRFHMKHYVTKEIGGIVFAWYEREELQAREQKNIYRRNGIMAGMENKMPRIMENYMPKFMEKCLLVTVRLQYLDFDIFVKHFLNRNAKTLI